MAITREGTTWPLAVEAEGLVRQFGEVRALDGVSLAVARGEFFSLLGPSGCGKTTLLRLIAGLDLPDAGWLRLGGEDMLRCPAHRRPVNTVFQSYALFPHLDVWANVAFGLRMKRVPKADLKPRVERALDLVQIAGLAGRRPSQLSGGQRQRVALARAIVNEPAVLLLDEPLGALDLQLRRQLQTELRALQRRLEITFLYVTHDQEEALAMSDRVAVMDRGRIVQVGEPARLYERPRTRFVAGFLGECNLIPGRCSSDPGTGQEPLIETSLGLLRVPRDEGVPDEAQRPPRTYAIRPERLRLLSVNRTADMPVGATPAGKPAVTGSWPLSRSKRNKELPRNESADANGVWAVVRQATYNGPETWYTLDAGGLMLRARVMNQGQIAGGFRPGEEVRVELPPEALVRLDE